MPLQGRRSAFAPAALPLYSRLNLKQVHATYNTDLLDKLIIFREVEADDFPTCTFTVSDCRFFKWPQAKHWYVKLPDGRDLVWDDQQKWNSREAAERACKAFLES